MKDKNVKDRIRKEEWEHPKRGGWGWSGWGKWGYHIKKRKEDPFVEKNGKTIHWEPYGRTGEYVKIVKTGQIVRKENIKNVVPKEVLEDLFIRNI